jgi:hypothetical protein
MFDEIIKKLIIILHSTKKPYFTPKNNKFKPKKNARPSSRYFVNTMD